MAVRDQPGPQIGTSGVDQRLPTIVLGDPPGRRLPPRWRLGLVLLLLAVMAVSVAWWSARDDSAVATRPVNRAGATHGAATAGLVVTVRGPTSVVAGETARYVVSYTDGRGIFSGGLEDWGDVGVGSVSEAVCAATAPAETALRASYRVAHTWSKPGSYPVSFAVTTYACRDGRAAEERRSAPLTVVVHAR